MKRNPRPLALAIALAFLCSAGRVGAQVSTISCFNPTSCTLAELFAGGQIQVDDKRFKGFGLEKLDKSAGGIADFNLITVQGISSALDPNPLDPGPGILFVGNGGLAANGVQYVDLRLDFRVLITNPAYKIKDSSAKVPSWNVSGKGWISINEFLTIAGGPGPGPGPGPGLGQLNIFAWEFPPHADRIEFAPQPEVYVEKNFLLEGTDPGDQAEINQFEQRYSQMPEPGMGSMLVSGALLLILLPRPARRGARRQAIHTPRGGLVP
jgi:hypothetical protein